ncbi:hypothetical protein PMAYCL1PPCAC_06715, partial [Pristionchus mayeri]
ELGKRKSKLENYIDSVLETPEKKQRKHDFEQSLRQFYRRKWNVPLKPPSVHGIEFDLFKLFEVVMAFGGWQKVSHTEKWSDVAEQFGIKEDILGGDNAVKTLYMRYLYKFEQTETVGDMDDMMDSEVVRGRNRQVSFLATSECPVYIPRVNHAEAQRLSSTEADYGRLTKSIISGLPNEVDFAINICTLLSHPGPRLLRVANAPNIVSLLLATIGIFDAEDDTMASLYSSWVERTERDYIDFWMAADIDEEYLKLFLPQTASRRRRKDVVGGDLLVGVTPSFASNDVMSWRVYQIATIFRNLSFEPVNKPPLAECNQLIKFCILASNSSWSQLATAALDTLSNFATDINLTSPRLLYEGGHSLLRTIYTGIYSNDKFKLIRSLELLAGLSGAEENEDILCQFVTRDFLSKVFSYLLVKDIMLCVYTLECIYQISEMGGLACEMICEVSHSLSMLLSLSSVEAVSFGSTGLAGMKVVEYHPPGSLPPSSQGMPPQGGMMGGGHHVSGLPLLPQHPLPPQGHHVPVGHHMPVPHSQPVISTVRVTPSTVHVPNSLQTSPAKQGENKIEQLSSQWIRSSCEKDEEASTSRGDLYAAYVDDMRNVHHSLSGSLQMFTNMIKSIFPEVEFKLPEGGTVMVVHGLRLNKPHKTSKGGVDGGMKREEKKENGIERKSTNPQVIPSAVEASSILPDASLHETKIVRVENTKREKSPESNGVNDEKGEKKDEGDEGEEKMENGVVERDEEEKEEEVKENGEEEKEDEDMDEEAETPSENKTNGKIEEKIVVAAPPVPSVRRWARGEWMCEWDGCGERFDASSSLLHHATLDHLHSLNEPSVCKWPGCDGTKRNKWSLVTHLQDHHASEGHLREASRKRKEGRAPLHPPKYSSHIPRETPQHPGYSKTAAIDAIRRHAFNFIVKDLTEEVEGPVTKSIRLTSCLILRNIARYSVEGRCNLRRYERSLSWMALSRLESNGALAQLLAELPKEEKEEDSSSSPASVPSANS